MASKPQLAFIRRYTCLYTRDLAKKAKAWQDGYLVFHHLNAKMVLLSDKFVILDECFFRAPGLNIMRDIPKTYNVRSDTLVSFDKHMATLDEAVYDEEKDISEIYQKNKRKNAADLDDFVDSDEDDADKRRGSIKRPRLAASPAPRPTLASPGAQSGWLYRTGNSSVESPKATTSSTLPGQTSYTGTPLRRLPANQVTPMRPFHNTSGQKQPFNSAPRTTTPFKAPSFVNGGSSNSSPVSSQPSSVPRRTLGSTRPSSSLVRQTLQAEWAKYADHLPNCAGKSKASSNSNLPRHVAKPPPSDEQRAKHLERIRNQPEPEIIPVIQKRPDVGKDDPSNWLFD